MAMVSRMPSRRAREQTNANTEEGLPVLLAWAIFLLNPWALPGPALYVAYITRFQIRPEEKVLRSRFGEAYAMYASGVRRWL